MKPAYQLFAAVGIAIVLPAAAWAQDLTVAAQVDKTTVEAGTPVRLSLSLTGDLTGVKLPDFKLPDGWVVVAQSQATNFTLRSGAAERSTSLQYVLVPQQAGAFQLGPFTVEQHGKTYSTEPITITVEKAKRPPVPPSKGERFTI